MNRVTTPDTVIVFPLSNETAEWCAANSAVLVKVRMATSNAKQVLVRNTVNPPFRNILNRFAGATALRKTAFFAMRNIHEPAHEEYRERNPQSGSFFIRCCRTAFAAEAAPTLLLDRSWERFQPRIYFQGLVSLPRSIVTSITAGRSLSIAFSSTGLNVSGESTR